VIGATTKAGGAKPLALSREDNMTMIRLAAAVAGITIAVASVASVAWAQQPQTVRVRGQIEKVDGDTLTVKARDGSTVLVKLANDARVTATVKAQLSDIKQGSFIGVTAMPQPDGSQKAIGVHIFMDSQRGVVADRHTPWDREPGSTMTNANVESTVASVDGETIMVKYKDGEKKVIVPPSTPVVSFAPGSKADLKTGAQIFIVAGQKQADGSITSPAITVGRDGAAPPM
jgi:ribosome maturation factor RimP